MPTFIAQKRLKVGENDFVEAGQPVDTSGWKWTIRETYVRSGVLKEHPDPVEPTASKTPAIKAKETSNAKRT